MSAYHDPDDVHYQNIDDDEAQGSHRLLRASVWIVSAFIAVAIIAIPVLRAVAVSEGNDREAAARDARMYVAEQFTDAALERRSTRPAARWAVPWLYEEVDDVVGYLQTRDEAELTGTEASLARVSCGATTIPDTECFEARLQRPGGPEVIRIRFTVGIVDGAARVVAVERISRI